MGYSRKIKTTPNNLLSLRNKKRKIIDGEILEIGKLPKQQQLMEDLGVNIDKKKKTEK